MIEVKVRSNETLEEALRRFRRKVRKSGLMQQIRRRGTYEKPSERRRRKERLAIKRSAEAHNERDDSHAAIPRYVR
ncbi:MAG: 30S ribosomal protein S21 [Fimbriimonadaceae bacterium]|nr:30S ribosomal protein S21 [Fimbriimonadaceae bacterium]